MEANGERRPPWPKVIAAFVAMFAVYQAAEGLQTIIAPGNPVGPALMVLALLLAWPLGRWLGGRGYGRFGLSLGRRWWAVLVGGLLLAALANLASMAVGLRFGIFEAGSPVHAITATGVAFSLLATFVPSVAEDILTRGFLLRVAPVRLNLWLYAILSALLYTGNHLWRFDWGISEQARLFCLGLAYGAAAWRWRSLWGAVALHWGWNLSNAVLDQLMAVQTADVVGGRALSGGAHLLLLAIVLLWVPIRRGAKT